MDSLSEGVYIEGFMKGFGQGFDRGFKPYETLMVQLTRYQCVRNLMKNGKRSMNRWISWKFQKTISHDIENGSKKTRKKTEG